MLVQINKEIIIVAPAHFVKWGRFAWINGSVRSIPENLLIMVNARFFDAVSKEPLDGHKLVGNNMILKLTH